MQECHVAKIADFAEGDRRIVQHADLEIGVFHWKGAFYAYENRCVHQGGPACEGVMMHKVEDVIAEDRTWKGQRFSDTMHIVCPWHGYEFDLKTGACVPLPKLKLRAFPVVTREGDVYVHVE